MFAEAERSLVSWAAPASAAYWERLWALHSHRVKQYLKRSLSVEVLWLRKQRFSALAIMSGTLKALFRMRAPHLCLPVYALGQDSKLLTCIFKPIPKCFKIIYVPIILHYVLYKDLISLHWRTQYDLSNFKVATGNMHLGTIFHERHSTPLRTFSSLWSKVNWWRSEMRFGVATKGNFVKTIAYSFS